VRFVRKAVFQTYHPADGFDVAAEIVLQH